MKRAFNLLLATLATLGVSGRDTSTAIFDPRFKSLQVLDVSNLLGQPVIKPNNASSAIRISFDELAESNRFLRYRLIHCNSDWQPSSLSELDYLDGFNIGDINDYALSERTLTHYVHYDLVLPNETMHPTVSGNYLVEIFDEDDPETVLLQARFMIDEGIARLSADVTSRTDYDYNGKHQQLSVTASLNGAKIENPYNDLKLVIIQNGREAERRELIHPLRAKSDEATYEHQKELIFPAGNEYRRFDLANVNYPGMGVEHFDYVHPYYNAMLLTDEPRADERYIYDQDQAGRYFPAEINSVDPDISADYVLTFFTLAMPRLDEDVFIDGDLVLRKRDADSRMVYDSSIGAYIKTLLLKQGMYNFQYVTPSGANPIEGDHYETGNEYLCLLYYCPPGARYDRLIGSTVIYSGK